MEVFLLFEILIDIMCNRRFDSGRYIKYNDKRYLQRYCISLSCFEPMVFRIFFNQKFRRIMNSTKFLCMNHKMTSKSQPYNRLLKVIFFSYCPASSAVPQDKFSHFLNTVLTLRIHPCIVKIGVAKSFIQYHLNLYTRFVQFHAISKRLDLQKVVLPTVRNVGGLFRGFLV